MDKEKRQLLEDADWKRISLELLKYARYLARGKLWRTGSGEMLPLGKSCEDLIQEAIRLAFDESRRWDHLRVDLPTFLKGIVRSLISHLAESDDNTKIREPRNPALLAHDGHGNDREDLQVPDPSLNPEELTIAGEEQNTVKQAYEMVLEEAKDRPELEGVILCLMDGKNKPQEIAIELGIDIKRVYQLKRQAIGILNSVAEKLNPMPMKGASHGKR
jgi:DNA-directed RNA polymerase specialized sigma24 family protein